MRNIDIYTVTRRPRRWFRRAKALWFMKREQYEYFKAYKAPFNKKGPHWPTQI